jgi:glyoxylase-like metal-dependent hydrolase (beta-lactamase superfamily II)
VATEKVHRLGTSLVNWYLVEDGGRFTVVDAALPRYRRQLDEKLASLGRNISDVEAVVLTHAHPDHVGAAESIRKDARAPVFVHSADREMAVERKSQPREKGMLPYLRHPMAWRLILHFAKSGMPGKTAEVTTFEDGEVLDVPGRPRVIHTPGHSLGHVSFHFERHGALIVGDAMCSLNPLTGARGPQTMPGAFNVSTAQALESLGRLEQVRDAVVHFGHGEPWTDGPASAVAAAREVGPT